MNDDMTSLLLLCTAILKAHARFVTLSLDFAKCGTAKAGKLHKDVAMTLHQADDLQLGSLSYSDVVLLHKDFSKNGKPV